MRLSFQNNLQCFTEVDWRLDLTNQPEQPISQAIVIETTPRVRMNHPAWGVDKLTPRLDSTDQVRISGWLMLDPEHADQVGQSRGTTWEFIRSPRSRFGRAARGSIWKSLSRP